MHPLPILIPLVHVSSFQESPISLPVTFAVHMALAYQNALYDTYEGMHLVYLVQTICTNINNSIQLLTKSVQLPLPPRSYRVMRSHLIPYCKWVNPHHLAVCIFSVQKINYSSPSRRPHSSISSAPRHRVVH